MAFHAEVVADSINTANGIRLPTMLWTYPRIIHSEVMTHRMLCRNAASSRAIPWKVMRENILNNPFIPLRFGDKQPGMQMGVNDVRRIESESIWLAAMNQAIARADQLDAAGVHKSLVNRLVEPWMWMTCLITATDWNNLWSLRIHKDAEIHFRMIAELAKAALDASEPRPLDPERCDWHLPFIDDHDWIELRDRGTPPACLQSEAAKISSARCARLSYLTHDGKRDIDADLDRFARLNPPGEPMHASPMEHPCMAVDSGDYIGPLRGWMQFRKMLPNENVPG